MDQNLCFLQWIHSINFKDRLKFQQNHLMASQDLHLYPFQRDLQQIIFIININIFKEIGVSQNVDDCQTFINDYFIQKVWLYQILTILFIAMEQKTNKTQFQKFLSNNKDYLDDKYQEYFHNQLIPIDKIVYETVVKYIYDVFQLDKDQSAPQMKNKVQQSLKQSVSDFFKNNPSKTFNSVQATKLLGFCIQNNDLFAVHYDMSEVNANIYSNNLKINHNNVLNSHEIQQIKNIANKIYKNSSIQQISQDNISRNQNQFTDQKLNYQKQQSKDHNIAQFQSAQISVDSNNNMKNSFLPSDFHIQRTQNEFDKVQVNDHIPSYDPKIVKKNIKLAFDFYCKQQMAIGVNNTFDYLENQKSTMNIGGFLIFAQYCSLIGRELSKRFLMSKFRKVSEGKSQIDFDTFYLLISQLHVIDSTLYARSKLDSLDFSKQLKAARLAFNTKDQNPRQLVIHRKFVNKLTGHTGKFQLELQQDFHRQSSNSSKIKQSHSIDVFERNARNRYSSEVIKTKDLQKLLFEKKKESEFIGKMISPQQNDNKWLYQYQIGSLSQKKSVHRQKQQTRQSKIIGNIKQRISQLQDKQKLYYVKRNTKAHKPAVYAVKN